MDEVRKSSFSVAGQRVEIAVRGSDKFWVERLFAAIENKSKEVALPISHEYRFHVEQQEVHEPSLRKRGGCPGGCPD